MDIGGDRQYFSAYQKCSKPRSLLQQKQTLESCYQSNINTRLSASIREHNCIFWCVFIFFIFNNSPLYYLDKAHLHKLLTSPSTQPSLNKLCNH